MIFLRIIGHKTAAIRELAYRNMAAISITEVESHSLPGYINTTALVLETDANLKAMHHWFSDCNNAGPFVEGTLLYFTCKDAGSEPCL